MRLCLLLICFSLYVGCAPSPRYATLLGSMEGSTLALSVEPTAPSPQTILKEKESKRTPSETEESGDDLVDFRETKAEVTQKPSDTPAKKPAAPTPQAVPLTKQETPPIYPQESTPLVTDPTSSVVAPAPIAIPFTPPKPVDTTILTKSDLPPDGLVSWYGPGFQGHKTASGEKFNMHDFTAAHRTLPFGTKVEVIVLSTGRSTIVRINDRGPHVQSRVIDVSKAAAQQLGIINTGPVYVALRIIE